MNLSLLGNMRRILIALFAICLAVAIVGVPACSNNSSDMSISAPSDPAENFKDITWPTRGLATMLPQPTNLFGEISSDRSDHFGAKIGNCAPEQFTAYVAACEELGFTENYSRNDESYVADNLEGYHLWLDYSSDHQYMTISLDAPDDLADDQLQNDATTKAPEESTEPETPENDADNEDRGKSNGNAAEESSDGNTALGEVTPDFKKAMDEYEAFFDEYIDFMKKYENSTDFSPEMLEDFNKYMERYNQTMEALNDIDADSLSPADYAYYTEVMLRINKKIAEM